MITLLTDPSGPRAQVKKGAIQIKKGRNREIESYSAFFDNAKGSSTGLADELHARNVSDVFVCGLATDVCVGEMRRERQYVHARGWKNLLICRFM